VVVEAAATLAAQQAASRVDFFNRKLPTLLVGLGKLRNCRITVDLANTDGRLSMYRQSRQRQKKQTIQ
jgi:hypothetical protein